MLQINGRLRGSLRVAADADKAVIEQAALDVARVLPLLGRRARSSGSSSCRAGSSTSSSDAARLLLGAAVSLAGCGFELKRPPELNFKTIQLAGFAPRSQLAIELKQNIESGPTTRVVEALKDAQVVLQSLGESREKVVVAQTAASQIREFELR